MSQEDTFDKISQYVGAELQASLRDYEFLNKINQTTTASFRDFNAVADKISKNINRINENQMARARLDKLVQTINEMDEKVTSLEALAYKIDSYSQRLEETYKKLNPQTPSSAASTTSDS